jgi:hypothetical protein
MNVFVKDAMTANVCCAKLMYTRKEPISSAAPATSRAS